MKKTNCWLRKAVVCTAVFSWGLALIGCKFIDSTSNSDKTPDGEELNRREILALQHLQKDHISTEDELANDVSAFLKDASAARGVLAPTSSISGVKKFTSNVEYGFSSVTSDARSAAAEPEPSEIPFYLFDLENPTEETKGFALTCGDSRIGNILAIVEDGSSEIDNPFMELYYTNLENYIGETIDLYNDITDNEIEAAVEKANEQQEKARAVSPSTQYNFNTDGRTILKTKWGQDGVYSDIINEAKGRANYSNDNKFVTGCTATAMAQIMAYWQYPNGCTKSPYTDIQYVWDDMKVSAYAGSITAAKFGGNGTRSRNAKRAIGALMYDAAESVGMNYGTDISTANPTTVAFRRFGFQTPSPFAGYNISNIISSIILGRPVLISGFAEKEHITIKYYFLWWVVRTEEYDTYKNGHAWVIDDYRQTTGISLASNGSRTYFPRSYVRCNLGWNGDKDGWYLSEAFYTSSGPVERSAKKERNYLYNLKIIPNIYR